MNLAIRLFCVAMLGTLLPSVELFGQTDSPQPHRPFRISTSISIGLTGTNYRTSFELVDENGMAYDIMSLVNNEPVRDAVELSKDQFRMMHELEKTFNQELSKKVVGAISSEEQKAKLESRFLEFQEELRAIMLPDQAIQLEQVRHMMSMQKHGIAEHLASDQLREQLDLTDDQLENVRRQANENQSSVEGKLKDLIREANEELLELLSAKEVDQFRELLTKEGYERFLGTLPITTNATWNSKPTKSKKSSLWLMRTQKIRSELGIDSSQLEKIKDLSVAGRQLSSQQVDDQLQSILDTDQLTRAYQLQIDKELKKYGTLKTLCYGLPSEELGLPEEDVRELFEEGKRIHEQLLKDMNQTRVDSMREAFSSLPADKQEQIFELIGNSMVSLAD